MLRLQQLAGFAEIEARQTRVQAGRVAVAEIAQEVGLQPPRRVLLAHPLAFQPRSEELLVDSGIIEAGHWPAIQAQRTGREYEISSLKGRVAPCGNFRQIRAVFEETPCVRI